MKNIAVLLITIASTALVTSCSKKSSKEELKNAQLCLNTAAASQARACVEKIASDTSAQANKLRCAAVFISENVTTTTFTEALDKLKNSGTCTGGCSSTVSAISALHFKSGSNLSTDAAARAANVATSAEAFTYCSQSGAKIYTDIASLFRIGTEAAMLAYPFTGGAAPTEDEIKTAVGNMDPTTVGTIVTTTYTSSCANQPSSSEGSDDAMAKYCEELGEAISGGASTADIGNCFINRMQNPAYVCP